MNDVLVKLPVDLVDRLAPGQLEDAADQARKLPPHERGAWIAGRLGIMVAEALEEIVTQARERREALLKLLDQVAAE